jgi:serine/threonine-protein kinase
VRCPDDGTALVPVEALLVADGDPFLGATVAGRFVIVGKLGAGSMGTVYRARQEAVGRDVAIKILRSDRAFDAMAKARFAREARAMSLLSSPHTVTVFDFGEIPEPRSDDLAPAESSLFLAMELLEGESLGARLKRRGRLSIEEGTRIAREALLSLAEAHDKGIIHRDLKPDNLFLARAGSAPVGEIVKVLDFGIAKLRVEQAERALDALETQEGTVFGTPRYMSPEQAQGKELDARSDLYTLGALLYQMLVGRPPFVDDDAVVVMARHIKSTAVPPLDAAPDAGIGAALSALVMRALSKHPDERPATAQIFLAELERAAREAGEGRRAPPAGVSREKAAVVDEGGHDGLGLSPVTSRASRAPARRVAGRASLLLVGASAVVVFSAGIFALAALRTARVVSARSEIAHLVAERRLALLQAEAATSAEASRDGTSSSDPRPKPRPPAEASASPTAAPSPASAGVETPPAPTAPLASGSMPHAPAASSGKKPPAGAGQHYRKFDL